MQKMSVWIMQMPISNKIYNLVVTIIVIEVFVFCWMIENDVIRQ